jgi:hypothetical protein
VTGVKNNERFARAGKANVNGKRPLCSIASWRHVTLPSSDNNYYCSKINLNIEVIKPLIDRHELKLEGKRLF